MPLSRGTWPGAAVLALVAALLLPAPAEAGRANVAALQAALTKLHLYKGFVDGVRGPLTRSAVVALPEAPRSDRRRDRRPPDAARSRTLRAARARQPRDAAREPGLGRRGAPVPAPAQGLRAGHGRRRVRRPDTGRRAARPAGRRHRGRRACRERDDRLAAGQKRRPVADGTRQLPAPRAGADRRPLRRAARGRQAAPGLGLPRGLRHPSRRRRRGHHDLRGAQLRGLRQPGRGPAPARVHDVVRAPVVDHDVGRRAGQRGHAHRLRGLNGLLHGAAPALRGAPLQHGGRPGADAARRGGEPGRRR